MTNQSTQGQRVHRPCHLCQTTRPLQGPSDAFFLFAAPFLLWLSAGPAQSASPSSEAAMADGWQRDITEEWRVTLCPAKKLFAAPWSADQRSAQSRKFWSAQPQSLPGVPKRLPNPKVSLACPTQSPGVPSPRVCLECPKSNHCLAAVPKPQGFSEVPNPETPWSAQLHNPKHPGDVGVPNPRNSRSAQIQRLPEMPSPRNSLPNSLECLSLETP